MFLKEINMLRYHRSQMNKIESRARPLRPITDDIFSQMPTQDLTYALDSFVVPDDQVITYSNFKYFMFE